VKSDLVKLAMRGIRRVHGKPQVQVAAALKEDIIIMLSHVADTVKGKRDRALLLLGFCGALRRSELVALRCTDLEFVSQGIVITLPRSKTDQTGQGRKIGIPRGRGRICPVQAVSDWLVHSGANNMEPVFRSITKGSVISAEPLSDRAVADIIKHYAQCAGLNAERYSGHSLRAGLATSAAQHGISSWKIRQQTGHKSDAMLGRYIRDGDLFTGNAAALF
jgi:integrase